MNRYIKLEGYDEWFLSIDKEHGRIPDTLTERMSKKLFRKAVGGSHNMDKGQPPSRWDLMVMIAAEGIDYEAALAKAPNDLLIRESGSYMYLHDTHKIVSDVIRQDFPRKKDDFAQVVICENDENLTKYWRHFFQRQYPDKTISVINFFDTRTDYDVKRYFEKADIVAFTTTFTSMDWWNLLVRNLQPHNKVEGVCGNEEGWELALSIYPNVKNLVKENE